jgi:surface polysaccharide O-acyltransferase-like enzyme
MPWLGLALSAMRDQTPSRNDAVDVIKGIGILFVVTNHCFARTSRKFLGVEVTEDLALYAINRAIHFAVPVFLFVSCALLARSFAKRSEVLPYARSRFRKTAIPYLIASILYYFLVFGTLAPDTWADLSHRIITGRAHFHLYFTIVLIQISVIVPLLVKGLATRKLPWQFAALGAVVLQVAMYTIQREWLQWERPGSVFLWYLVPIFLGVAVGRDRGATDDIQRSTPLLGGIAVVSMAAYVWSSVAPLRGAEASSDLINLTYALFTAALALVLWAAAPTWPTGRLRTYLRKLGEVSLPLFLVHPAIMFLLGGPRITSLLKLLPGPMLVYWALTLTMSYGFAVIATKLRLGQIILGQTASVDRR